MRKISCLEKPMPPVECREGFGGEPSYAAVFARALLDPDLATPAVVAGPKSNAADKRYNVYRNNVTVTLINALALSFDPAGAAGRYRFETPSRDAGRPLTFPGGHYIHC